MRNLNSENELVALDLLKHHPRNANHGNVEEIKKSLAVNGWYGSVIVNKQTNHILAGNHRVMAARALGWSEVPVQWVDVSPEQELRILVVDNRTTRLGADDSTIIADILAELSASDLGLEGTGYADIDLDGLINELAGVTMEASDAVGADAPNYARSIEAPEYVPTGECPPVSELAGYAKYESLVGDIEASDVPEDVKLFLLHAASRHIVFDYQHIAEYYAHAPESVQQLMEDSALVIIDFNSALKNGFVKMVEQLQDILGADMEVPYNGA